MEKCNDAKREIKIDTEVSEEGNIYPCSECPSNFLGDPCNKKNDCNPWRRTCLHPRDSVSTDSTFFNMHAYSV